MRENIQKRERMRRKFENEIERYMDRQIERGGKRVGSTSIWCIYVIISLNDIARDNKLTSIFSLANIVHFDPNRTMQTLFKRSQHLIPLRSWCYGLICVITGLISAGGPEDKIVKRDTYREQNQYSVQWISTWMFSSLLQIKS